MGQGLAALAPSDRAASTARHRRLRVFKAAVRDRRIASSPCEGDEAPEGRARKVVPLATEAGRRRSPTPCPRSYRALVILARRDRDCVRARCFGLTVDRVDFLRRAVEVDRQLVGLRPAGHRVRAAEDGGERPHHPAPPGRRRGAGRAPAAYPGRGRTGWSSPATDGQPLRRPVSRPRVAAGGRQGGAAPDGTGSTSCGTTTPRCSSGTASRSRPSRPGWATRAPPRRWTPTATCGRTRTTGRGPRSTQCSERCLRTPCGLLRAR